MDSRSTVFSRLWVLGSVGYGVLRTLLVWRYLSGRGVHPLWFATVEISSSLVYGWASARLVLRIVRRDWRPLRILAPVTLCAYAAPDVFVLTTVGDMPDGLLATVLTVIVVSLVFSIVALTRAVRRGRQAPDLRMG